MLQLDFLPRALPLDTFLLGADGFGFPAEAGKIKQVLYLLLPGRHSFERCVDGFRLLTAESESRKSLLVLGGPEANDASSKGVPILPRAGSMLPVNKMSS